MAESLNLQDLDSAEVLHRVVTGQPVSDEDLAIVRIVDADIVAALVEE